MAAQRSANPFVRPVSCHSISPQRNLVPFERVPDDDRGRDRSRLLAWTERGHATLRPSVVDGDARSCITTSVNGTTWSVPRADSAGRPWPPTHAGADLPRRPFASAVLRPAGRRLADFSEFVDELNIAQANSPVRHTMDVFLAQASPGAAPAFTSARLSDYAFGFFPVSPRRCACRTTLRTCRCSNRARRRSWGTTSIWPRHPHSYRTRMEVVAQHRPIDCGDEPCVLDRQPGCARASRRRLETTHLRSLPSLGRRADTIPTCYRSQGLHPEPRRDAQSKHLYRPGYRGALRLRAGQ